LTAEDNDSKKLLLQCACTHGGIVTVL